MTRTLATLCVLTFLTLALASVHLVVAAPTPGDRVPRSVQQSPDWMSAETAARLDLAFDVLVPTFVPAPFAGEPAVSASAGAYSLYWLIPGSPPTYLHISGKAGGVIPDYSAYDRNNQLVVNASVQGYEAYHDFTPIYDLVYWQVGDVVYAVESRGLTETDSLSLANGLIPLLAQPGSGESDGDQSDDGSDDDGPTDPPVVEPSPSLFVPDSVQSGATASITIAGAGSATLTVDVGSFPDSGTTSIANVGESTVNWQAPATTSDLTASFILINPSNGEWLATGQTVVVGTPLSSLATTASLACDSPVAAGDRGAVALTGSGTLIIDATYGAWPASAPNTSYAPDADGGSTLVGTLRSGGSAALVWQAPAITQSVTAYIFATDTGGVTHAECAVAIVAAPNREPAAAAPVETDDDSADPSEAPTGGSTITADGTGSGNVGASSQGIDDGTGGSIVRLEAEAATDDGVAAAALQSEPGDATGIGSVATTEARPTADADGPTRTPEPGATTGGSPRASPTSTGRPGSPTPEPTATLAPSSGPNGMVARVIGPEGGELTNPAGANLTIPPGALTEDATVTIVPVADTNLPVVGDVEFVPGAGFDVTVANASGNSIEELEIPATLTIELEPEQWRRGLQLYRIDGSTPQPLAGSALGDSSVTAEANHFSRFAAGLPTETEPAARDPLPFLLGATGLVVVLLAIVGYVTAQQRRRPRAITPRRRSPPRSRFR